MVKKIKFPPFPLIFIWVQHEYDTANTVSDLVELYHKWIRVSEITDNKTKAKALKAASYALYSEVTGYSFDTVLNFK